MMTNLTLSREGTTHELQAKRVRCTDLLETWHIWNRADQTRFVTLSNDRPRLQSIHQYRTRYKWTIEEGDVCYRKMVSQITAYLEYYIKGFWQMPSNQTPVINRIKSPEVNLFL